MKNGPSAFKISPVAAGVLSLLGAAAVPAHAANWQVGDVSISLDSTFTLATSIRTEARDYDLIGNSNHPQFDWSGYHAAFNPLYPSGDVWGLADGGYSTNGDLGNLAHDPGDAFATQISGTHELDINFGDYGFFARGFWFYDFEQMDGDRPYSNPITGNQYDLCQDPEAEDLLCTDGY